MSKGWLMGTRSCVLVDYCNDFGFYLEGNVEAC